ncbi:MAG: hypothetical protein ACT4OT_11630 [Acidobacteriota bacterium]
MPPQTIDEILVELDQIILRARQDRSRLGLVATRTLFEKWGG